ncbi:MAG: hypothetical protein AAGA69_01075 [Pseudomonadota bacterium]
MPTLTNGLDQANWSGQFELHAQLTDDPCSMLKSNGFIRLHGLRGSMSMNLINLKLALIFLCFIIFACTTPTISLAQGSDPIALYPSERFRSSISSGRISIDLKNTSDTIICINPKALHVLTALDILGIKEHSPSSVEVVADARDNDLSYLAIVPLHPGATTTLFIELGADFSLETLPYLPVPYTSCRSALETTTVLPSPSDVVQLTTDAELDLNDFSDTAVKAEITSLVGLFYKEWAEGGGKILFYALDQ